MRTLLLILLFLALALPASALVLSGTVIDSDSEKPLEGVTVGINDLKITQKTGKDGGYRFDDLGAGFYQIFVVHPEYRREIITVRIKRNFRMEIRLKKGSFTLDVIEKRYQRSEDRFGTQSISYENIKELPGRGFGDSLHLLQTLPGVGSSFALAPVPLIRGSNPINDKYYVDDIPLDYPYHYLASSMPIFSSLNEEIIDRATIIKGPSPLYYDDSLGNIIHVKTKDPEQTGVHGKVLLDPIVPLLPTVHATVVPYKDFSIMFNGRRTYIDLAQKAMDSNTDEIFYMQDHYLKMRYNAGRNHSLYFISLGSDDTWLKDKKNSQGQEYTRTILSRYHTEALKWEYLINRKAFLQTVVSRYQINQRITQDDIDIRFEPLQYRLNQMLTLSLKPVRVKAGYEILRLDRGVSGNTSLSSIANTELSDQKGTVYLKTPIEGTAASGFLETGVDAGPFWINAGGRYKYYGPLSDRTVSYRGMAGVNLTGKTALYLGGGTYYSYPDMYHYLGVVEPDFKPARADNGILGVKSNFYENLTGQCELFYTRYRHLPYKPGDLITSGELKTYTQINPYSPEERGYSYGAEFFLKADGKRAYGWISYTYSVSRRSSPLVDQKDFYSDFDQTHILRLVLATRVERWTFSSIWHLYTPLPYTPITGSTYDSGEFKPVYGNYNSGRYALHYRHEIKVTYTTAQGHRFYAEAFSNLGTGNYLFPDFEKKKAYSDNSAQGKNPRDVSDTPAAFLWLGVEICF